MLDSADEAETAPDEQRTLLDHAERVASLGSWQWTPGTGELVWSDNLYRLFGLRPRELRPTAEFVLQRVHPVDRRLVEETLARLTEGEPRTVEYRALRADGTVRVLRATVASIVEGGPRARRIVGSVQDVTGQRRMDRALAAHAAVTRALDAWPSLEPGGAALLRAVALALDFCFGALWVPEGSALAPRALWASSAPALMPLVVDVTRRWRPRFDATTVGRALTTQEPALAGEPSAGEADERTAVLRRAGIRGTIAVPAVAGRRTLAVMEFLTCEPPDAGPRLIRALHGIGHEVGHFLDRRHGELAAPELSEREIAVLQLAARGLPAPAIAEQLHVSPATVKRHFERAYLRLGVSDRAAAVAEAMRRNLIT